MQRTHRPGADSPCAGSPVYEQGEPGLIPGDWEITTLGALGRTSSGGTPSSSDARFWGGDIPWISSKDMKVSRLHDAVDHVTPLALGNGTRLVTPGTILMVVLRLNGKAHQIQTSEYRTYGRHPVVDQSASTVAAFSDRSDRLFSCPSSGVIVFGDHTCVFKFIDFDFLVGADGTQLLDVQGWNVTRFFFYQLLTKDVPNTGYNRHFKLLQDLTFIVPSQSEQTAIAAVLTDMDAEVAVLERRLDKVREIKQGMMQQLLTGRVRLV